MKTIMFMMARRMTMMTSTINDDDDDGDYDDDDGDDDDVYAAIWMMPADNHYGGWPKSGEIDIMEATGRRLDYSVLQESMQRG